MKRKRLIILVGGGGGGVMAKVNNNRQGLLSDPRNRPNQPYPCMTFI